MLGMCKRREVECPHCGGLFREGRTACPHCGADRETGWLSAEEQDAASLELQETSLSDADYDSFVRQNDLSHRRPARSPPKRLLAERSPATALLLLALLLAFALWKALR